jgi:hypothetical protein
MMSVHNTHIIDEEIEAQMVDSFAQSQSTNNQKSLSSIMPPVLHQTSLKERRRGTLRESLLGE